MLIESHRWPSPGCTKKLNDVLIPLVKESLNESEKENQIGCLVHSYNTETRIAKVFASVYAEPQKTGDVAVEVPLPHKLYLYKHLSEHEGEVYVSESWFLEDEIPLEFRSVCQAAVAA